MSRSYRKPYFTDQQAGRKSSSSPSRAVFEKRRANRKIREANKQACGEKESEELKDGKSYKKKSCSWNIRDWSFRDEKNPKARRK